MDFFNVPSLILTGLKTSRAPKKGYSCNLAAHISKMCSSLIFFHDRVYLLYIYLPVSLALLQVETTAEATCCSTFGPACDTSSRNLILLPKSHQSDGSVIC